MASKRVCGTPNGGWTRRRDRAERPRADGGDWSSWTTTNSGALPAAIAVYRAAQARLRGDVAGTITHAQRGPRLPARTTISRRGAAAALLALALLDDRRSRRGAPLVCRRRWRACRRPGTSPTSCGTRHRPGGHPDRARVGSARRCSTYERGWQLATKQGSPTLRGAADMHVGMGELLRERNDLRCRPAAPAAQPGPGRAHSASPQNPYRWHVAMARIREAQGDLDGALRAARGGRAPVRAATSIPTCGPSPPEGAAVDRAGTTGRGSDWARERGLSAEDELSYLREFEHITLARVLLAQSAAGRGRRLDAARRGAPRSPPDGGGSTAGGRGASSRSWCCRRSPTTPAAMRRPALASAARARADAGRAGGLRPDVRRRGRADDGPARSGREARDRAGPMSADSLGGVRPDRDTNAASNRPWSSR